MSPSHRSALPRCSGLGLPRVFHVTNSTPSPCRWRASPCWCRSPAPSTTTIWRFSAAPWRCSAPGSLWRPRVGWLAVALLGLIAASWAKLTGLLLTGAMLGAVIVYLMWRRHLRLSLLVPIGLAFALAAAPYIIYAAQYGSPTPQTPAQIALLADNARAAGWTDLPRKSFPAYIVYFVIAFVADWMPALGER